MICSCFSFPIVFNESHTLELDWLSLKPGSGTQDMCECEKAS